MVIVTSYQNTQRMCKSLLALLHSEYINVIYALGSAHVKLDVLIKVERTFAVLFVWPGQIELQGQPKYKSVKLNRFIRRTLHVPNLIIRFGHVKFDV